MSGTFNFAALGIFSVVAIIFAIAATVLAFIFVVPEKKREKLGTFGKFVHDTVNFKYLIVEKILQALYIFCNGIYDSLRLLHAVHDHNYLDRYALARRLGYPFDAARTDRDSPFV